MLKYDKVPTEDGKIVEKDEPKKKIIMEELMKEHFLIGKPKQDDVIILLQRYHLLRSMITKNS